ncbi:hypothetical protein [Pseudomonas helleri]|uniref:Uncharacterized protein n=2 Tax=Pseudomonas helleri TaxID=1608996 RepID=A0A7X1Y8F5_9PSED|nr:hypothetical protein [Pseudomonas helleri]MQU31153.1 hypothetical protein [Pseudomonas helleri]
MIESSLRKVGLIMFLAKNCKKEDNLKTRKTIKLATLHHYRNIESAQIVDKGEGKYSFFVKLDGTVEIERRWFALLFQGGVAIDGDQHYPRIMGPLQVTVHELQIVEIYNQTVKVRNASASIHREALNGFIFCMSAVSELHDALGLFPDYDDCWYMTATKAHDLAAALSRLLWNNIISGRHSGNHIVDPHASLENLSIHFGHAPVSYIDREIHISDSSVFTVDHFMRKIVDMGFVKPPSFSPEKEYRFSFTIVAGDKILIPIVDSVILNAEQLVDWAL